MNLSFTNFLLRVMNNELANYKINIDHPNTVHLRSFAIMSEFPAEEQKSAIDRFFNYVVWPALRNLVQDLVQASEIPELKDTLGIEFASCIENAVKSDDEYDSNPTRPEVEDGTLSVVPDWVKSMLENLLDDFSRTLARYFRNAEDGNLQDLIDYVDHATIVYFFEMIVWKFVHDTLMIQSRIPVNGVGEIKEKMLDLLRRYLDGDLSLKEAKHSTASFLQNFDMDNDLVYEIVTSYLCGFFETIEKVDVSILRDIIDVFSKNHGSFLDNAKAADPLDQDNRAIAMKWFEKDVIGINIKAIGELFPELTKEEIQGWQAVIAQNLDMLIDNLLSVEDFEKRALAALKTPQLQFDIEKPVDDNDLVDRFLSVEDRSGILESILANAELIYQAAQKDSTLKDFAERIIAKKKSLDHMYI